MRPLRFFTGLTEAQAAEHQGASVATVERTWMLVLTPLFNDIKRNLAIPSGVRETPPRNRVQT